MVTEQAEPAAKLPAPTGQLSPVMAKSPGFVPVNATMEKVTGLFPVLEIVTLCAALVVPVFWRAKVRLEGEKLRVCVGVCPFPLSPIDCGLPLALSVNEMDALRVPVAVGEKVTVSEQFPPAARLPAPTGHASVAMAKSPGFVPVNTTLEKVTGLLPVLVMVTPCAALVVPVF